MAAVVSPSIIRTHLMHVEIETTGQWTAGRTECDIFGRLGKEPNVCVGYALDVEEFWVMVISTIVSY